MTFKELVDLVDGDSAKASGIWEVSKIIGRYAQFKSIMSLGLTMDYNELGIEKALMFSWIKEAIENGRKT